MRLQIFLQTAGLQQVMMESTCHDHVFFFQVIFHIHPLFMACSDRLYNSFEDSRLVFNYFVIESSKRGDRRLTIVGLVKFKSLNLE